MAPPPLRVGANVDGSRMTITFSQRACAQKYNDYLKMLAGRVYETLQCRFSASQNAVFMSLPAEITIAPPSLDEPNKVTLTFKDTAKAKAWEEKLILWKRDVEGDDTAADSQLSLVIVWKVDDFQKRLGFSKQDDDDEQETVFAVHVPEVSGGYY